jgi:hypothetical protein
MLIDDITISDGKAKQDAHRAAVLRANVSAEGHPLDKPDGTLWRSADHVRELAICPDSSAHAC